MMPSLSTYFFIYLYIYRDLTWHFFFFFLTSADECKPGNMFFFSVFTIKWKKCTRLHGITQLQHKVQIQFDPSVQSNIISLLLLFFFLLMDMSSWSILASAHTHSPSWLLPPTLAHMTHTFHHAITAKSFIKKIKLTSRQSRSHVSSL